MIDTIAPMKSIIMIHVTWLSSDSSTELMADVKLVDGGVINQQNMTWEHRLVPFYWYLENIVVGKHPMPALSCNDSRWLSRLWWIESKFLLVNQVMPWSVVAQIVFFSANIFHDMISLSPVSISSWSSTLVKPVVKLHWIPKCHPIFLALWCLSLVHLPLTPKRIARCCR